MLKGKLYPLPLLSCVGGAEYGPDVKMTVVSNFLFRFTIYKVLVENSTKTLGIFDPSLEEIHFTPQQLFVEV